MKTNRLMLSIACVAIAVLAIACGETTTTTNTTTANTAASNTAVVVNNNGNANTSTVSTLNGNSRVSNINANITREEYDRDKDRYAKEAKDAGSTIGAGAEDGWLWVKTRSALLTTDDLRDSTINVDVNNNVVTLKGAVANAAQKTKAEQVAKGIKDVKSVKNELKVSASDSILGTDNKNAAHSNANAAKKS